MSVADVVLAYTWLGIATACAVAIITRPERGAAVNGWFLLAVGLVWPVVWVWSAVMIVVEFKESNLKRAVQ